MTAASVASRRWTATRRRARRRRDVDGRRVAASCCRREPIRFAYADPPYPGKAGKYPENREVDHASLVDRLVREFPDGWALSTSAEALRDVLPLCPLDVRVCAWRRRTRRVPSYRALSSWEPLIVAGGRPHPVDVAQDLEDSLVCESHYRAFPGAMVGMKPPEFAVWMFRQLGAGPGDEFVDVFRGSGAVAKAWLHFAGESDASRAAAAVVDGSDASPVDRVAA